jgi:hypothetical protein
MSGVEDKTEKSNFAQEMERLQRESGSDFSSTDMVLCVMQNELDEKQHMIDGQQFTIEAQQETINDYAFKLEAIKSYIKLYGSGKDVIIVDFILEAE